MCKSKPLVITYEQCHELLEICTPSPFRLEEESGLKWKVNRQGTKGKGSWAGCVNKEKVNGTFTKYWRVKINNKQYFVSRIIYFMYHGVDPYPFQVDHKDINSLNNNVDNLRLGGPVLQSQNQRTRSNNKSGVKGVFWNKQKSKWEAQIKVENKKKYLGSFATVEEAAEARNAAVRECWPEEVWSANLIDIELI